MVLSHLLSKRLNCSKIFSLYVLFKVPVTAGFSSLSPAPESSQQSVPSSKPSSLSARLSFIFDQIDEIDKNRQEKDETLQRIRAWRESKKKLNNPVPDPPSSTEESESLQKLNREVVKSEPVLENGDIKRDVELVHPWPEWIELMERLLQQNYFDHRRKDEDGMMEGLGIDVPDTEPKEEDMRPDFARHFKTVQSAMVNFGRDRFDILRALSRQDLQILVGYGCPSADRRVVYSGKLLRKFTHLDEGDVCSSCNLRGSCEKAYLLTNKEDEARTIDVMRILLTYGFEPLDGSVTNKALMNMKSVKTVIRKLLHQVVNLSAVPIDPNLTPPVVKKPPPKVKQPPPPPKKRVGRYDVEMKKGDWLCTKCDFLNFAKNTVCMQCEAKRPKRQLLPGEWECPQCNFLNYRRNAVCFHCEHNRPLDTYTEKKYPEKQHIKGMRTDKVPDRAAVSNAWNFDFDDDESDGADVAAFEYADSQKIKEDFPLGKPPSSGNARRPEHRLDKSPREYAADSGGSSRPGMGFNDFDDEEDDVDGYELVAPNEARRTSGVKFSDLDTDSEYEDVEINEGKRGAGSKKTNFSQRGPRKLNRRGRGDGDVDFDTDDDLPVHPDWKSSHVANPRRERKNRNPRRFGSEDDDDDFNEFSADSEDDGIRRSKKERNGRSSSNSTRRGGQRRSYRDDSFSEADSDEELRHQNRKKRGGGFDQTERRGSIGSSREQNSRGGGGRGGGGERSRRNRENQFDGRRRGGSIEKRGGRSAKFDDSYGDDERGLRPRTNVR